MNFTNGKKAKSFGESKRDKLDWDYDEKQWRVIALCHLYKYLSVKEYRDRLRETYPQTLVECPNGKDYEYGLVQNLETNIFEGHNCSGRTSMLIRDMMIKLENETIKKYQEGFGKEPTLIEREAAYEELYAQLREKFDNDKQVIKDSKPLLTIIDKHHIPKTKKRKPKPFVPPTIDRNTKCLVVDFDDTLFDTSADDAYRKGKEKDLVKAREMIPQYRLYDGWREVIDWTQKNGVKIAILSSASGKLIEKAMQHFNIPCAAIIGYQPYMEKPNTILGNMLQERLNIRHEQIIYVGNSNTDETQARASQFRFFGATWGSYDADYFTENGIQTIGNPKDIIPILEEAGWSALEPTVTAPAEPEVEPEAPKKKRAVRKTETAPKPIKQEYPLEGRMYHSILGAVIGDIAGSSREGYSRSTYKTDFKFFTEQSNLTDDTVLTIALADWLNNKDTLKVKDALLKWGRMFPNAGYGSGFKSFIRGDVTFVNFSTANGAAMRVSPVAIKASSLDEALKMAKESAKPTHSRGGVKGAQAIAAAVYLAKDGVAKGKSTDEIKAEIKSTIEERFKYNLNLTIEEIREQTKKYGEMKARMKRSRIPSIGYTRMSDANYSCPEAIIAALQANTYEEAVRIAISMGGDSDTVAAMAGSIAAQMFGIPEALVKRTLVFLPSEMIEVINEFEGTDFKPTGIAPPRSHHWTKDDYVVYGDAPKGQKGEDGKTETIPSRFNNKPVKGYPIPTIGKSLDEIRASVSKFIEQAKKHPERRYHIRKVGYHKAGYTVQQIAPLFEDAVGLKNVLLPEEMLNELKKETE